MSRDFLEDENDLSTDELFARTLEDLREDDDARLRPLIALHGRPTRTVVQRCLALSKSSDSHSRMVGLRVLRELKHQNATTSPQWRCGALGRTCRTSSALPDSERVPKSTSTPSSQGMTAPHGSTRLCRSNAIRVDAVSDGPRLRSGTVGPSSQPTQQRLDSTCMREQSRGRRSRSSARRRRRGATCRPTSCSAP